MATSRYRPLKPVEVVILAELVMEDLRADRGELTVPEAMSQEDAAAILGTLTIDALGVKARPMPIGHAISELAGMSLVEKPRKSNGREVSTRLKITQAGEDAVLRDLDTAVQRFIDESKTITGNDAAELKARKSEWAARIKRVKEAVDALRAAAQPVGAPNPEDQEN